MGVIARQSFKAGIVTYSGIILGVLNQIIFYPLLFSVSEYGEIQFILQTAAVFNPILQMGFGSALLKYYSKYSENEVDKQNFYGLVFGVVGFNLFVFLAIFLVFHPDCLDYFISPDKVRENSRQTLILIAATIPVITISRVISSIHGRIAIPSLLGQLIKFFLPLMALSYFLDFLDFNGVVKSILVFYILLAFINLAYAFTRETIRPRLSLSYWINGKALRAIVPFAFFSFLTGIGGSLTNQIDILMITSMLGTYQNGLYSWALFIANAVAIPFGLVSTISGPQIAKFWKDRNLPEIDKLYKQTSATLFTLCLGIFLSFWVSIDYLFEIMPKGDEYKMSKMIVLLLSLGVIIDVACGINSQIISLSKYYRYMLLFLVTTAIINVGLNYILIPTYGIEGSGYATIVSLLFFNAAKYLFIKFKIGLQPFSLGSFKVAVIAITIFVFVHYIPDTNFAVLNAAIHTGFMIILFFGLIYRFNLAPELNNFVNKQLIRLGIKPFDKK